ncbi:MULTISPECIES: hypothetical protein [Shimia]|uniref:hypothetical protein n=1 Tax=Shimia TaxID=573139 RepID=UPI001FB4F2C5|nr:MULTISPECIES: hypothetical protein [Shimia]MDV4143435.1 hypothetical protein [Shimia sp. FJ5]
MKKAFFILPAAIALAACTQSMEITQKPVDFAHVSTKNKVVRLSAVPVRTYAKGEDGKSKEIGGAVCTIKSDEFKTSFTSPAIVRFPTTEGKSAPLDVACKLDEKTATGTLEPKLHANYASVTSGTHAGAALFVTLVAAAATHAVATERDHWAFVKDPESGLHFTLK